MPENTEQNPPAVALTAWAARHGIRAVTARAWAREGQPLHGRVWHSGGRDLLIRPDEPVPATRPAGRPKRQD